MYRVSLLGDAHGTHCSEYSPSSSLLASYSTASLTIRAAYAGNSSRSRATARRNMSEHLQHWTTQYPRECVGEYFFGRRFPHTGVVCTIHVFLQSNVDEHVARGALAARVRCTKALQLRYFTFGHALLFSWRTARANDRIRIARSVGRSTVHVGTYSYAFQFGTL